MPSFQYRAVETDGSVVGGILVGDNREQIVAQLQAKGQIPIRVDHSIKQAKAWSLKPRQTKNVSQQQVADTTRYRP